MSKFQNKYRIESTRLPDYDYSKPGGYFVTICTQNKTHCFGEIDNGKMILNEYGKIVENCWKKIPEHFTHITLDYFVIMPNHTHGIIIINPVETQHAASLHKQNKISVETQHAASLQNTNKLGCLVSGSLPVIIRSFKSACSKQINTLRNSTNPPIWQPRFYEHIIRNEKSLLKIREYITNNPLNWELDELYTK